MAAHRESGKETDPHTLQATALCWCLGWQIGKANTAVFLPLDFHFRTTVLHDAMGRVMLRDIETYMYIYVVWSTRVCVRFWVLTEGTVSSV